jgi:hypothetical protein
MYNSSPGFNGIISFFILLYIGHGHKPCIRRIRGHVHLILCPGSQSRKPSGFRQQSNKPFNIFSILGTLFNFVLRIPHEIWIQFHNNTLKSLDNLKDSRLTSLKITFIRVAIFKLRFSKFVYLCTWFCNFEVLLSPKFQDQ